MSIDPQNVRCGNPEGYLQFAKFVGGSAAVTKVHGRNVTTTYISTGIVDIALVDNPGRFLGVTGFGFEATTQGDLKGYSVVAGVMNTTTNTLRLKIYDSTFALANLAALQWLSMTLFFEMAGTGV